MTCFNMLLAGPVAYLGGLTLAAGVVSRRPEDIATIGAGPSTHFAVLVPAHNEAATISSMLQSTNHLIYPCSLYSVHVVADNCVDETARVAASFDVDVHERDDVLNRGKGPALNWLIERVLADDARFDVAVFIDADTTVSPVFLAELDRCFRSGARAVQGNYSVREAFDSVPAALRYCALACRHHLRPLGRTAIGGSCGLFGNGMALDRELVAKRRWTNHLVEDMEYQAELLLEGVKVIYAPRAQVKAEMPHSFDASVTQHQRWERGRVQMARRFGPQFARRLVFPGRVGRVAAADELADLCVPPLSLLAPAVGLSAALTTGLAFASPKRWRVVNAAMSVAMTVTMFAHVLVGLHLSRAPRAAYAALLRAPQLVLWKVTTIVRLRSVASKDAWIRTPRNLDGQEL